MLHLGNLFELVWSKLHLSRIYTYKIYYIVNVIHEILCILSNHRLMKDRRIHTNKIPQPRVHATLKIIHLRTHISICLTRHCSGKVRRSPLNPSFVMAGGTNTTSFPWLTILRCSPYGTFLHREKTPSVTNSLYTLIVGVLVFISLKHQSRDYEDKLIELNSMAWYKSYK